MGYTPGFVERFVQDFRLDRCLGSDARNTRLAFKSWGIVGIGGFGFNRRCIIGCRGVNRLSGLVDFIAAGDEDGKCCNEEEGLEDIHCLLLVSMYGEHMNGGERFKKLEAKVRKGPEDLNI